ncbi:hypothetical protein PFISCL1PPCAC_6757 [Pristionchus fissidentatus]|uniref:GYF domain-containing protein n=1 Tax=Pristionchus fissidentatus TaxID=1538716 RepID=A0AAV5VA80_9BILA|nr:hypothetical protein PFISCL1PPCAC_6757 [Pristionchus fissidentatus]
MSTELAGAARTQTNGRLSGDIPIWYRETASAEKSGPFNLSTILEWYESNRILLSSQFSFDDGVNWETIFELRSRNGPSSPFIARREGKEETKEGCASIAVAREMVAASRAEVEQLETAKDAMEKELREQEEMLEKMKEMEKELERMRLPKRDKYAQVEGRQLQISAKLLQAKRDTVVHLPNVIAQGAAIPVANIVPQSEVHDSETDESAAEEPMQEEVKGTSDVSPSVIVARPIIFPMLQASTMMNDYSGGEGVLSMLRRKVEQGIPDIALNATNVLFDPPPMCQLCENPQPLRALPSFLDHVLSPVHIDKISSSGGQISAAQCFYWLEILQKGYTSRAAV